MQKAYISFTSTLLIGFFVVVIAHSRELLTSQWCSKTVRAKIYLYEMKYFKSIESYETVRSRVKMGDDERMQ